MEGVSFIKGLDKEKVYIIGFDSIIWDLENISSFMKLAKESGLNAIGVITVNGKGMEILEPIGIDKEKLKELLSGSTGPVQASQ